ncbi:MAG TPA: Xaa-Pro peptidase family protein [Gemmatimonadaceae bacterium]|jgi:Xaa-Pro aminopeptidase|nr:Xaa-Pro peptidase family protein [Gemmatimonadaceae bacterium]
MLNKDSLADIQKVLADSTVDGWLIFDFHGLNPVAAGILGLQGMGTRRIFAFIPKTGSPVAITHAIEQAPWKNWPGEWNKIVYTGWRELEAGLAEVVKGKIVAMEYSPGDAVPYLDRIPAGVLEMVRNAGADVVSSADLVSRFYAVWTEDQLASHKRTAEILARIARSAFEKAGDAANGRTPLTEYKLQQWILGEFSANALQADHGPIVAIGPNAANPHFEPSPHDSAPIMRGSILLIDLWAREEGGVFADQTWMGSLGEPSDRDRDVWLAVRDGRDAAIKLLHDKLDNGGTVKGGEVDDAVRAVIASRGFGDRFIHRTGHSIDARDLHGSGPHIDNLETREERALIPGVGFSIEPGVYLPGEVGMRSEVNGFVSKNGVIITPQSYQNDLIIV